MPLRNAEPPLTTMVNKRVRCFSKTTGAATARCERGIDMYIHSDNQLMTHAVRPTGGPVTGHGQSCPRHPHITLDGGPVLFRCEPHGHSVVAADISHEFMPRERARAQR